MELKADPKCIWLQTKKMKWTPSSFWDRLWKNKCDVKCITECHFKAKGRMRGPSLSDGWWTKFLLTFVFVQVTPMLGWGWMLSISIICVLYYMMNMALTISEKECIQHGWDGVQLISCPPKVIAAKGKKKLDTVPPAKSHRLLSLDVAVSLVNLCLH